MEYVIFDDKTLSDVFRDIYKNTESKREQINTFVTKLVQQIRTPEDAAIISPIIKDFMEVNVRNDEHIVRIAQIAQRAIAIGTKSASSAELLTEEEKQQKQYGIDVFMTPWIILSQDRKIIVNNKQYPFTMSSLPIACLSEHFNSSDNLSSGSSFIVHGLCTGKFSKAKFHCLPNPLKEF